MVLNDTSPADSGSPALPGLTCYVRQRGVIDDRFIEFDFAIGDPSLYVEMVLPVAAFEQFCRLNRVQMMTEEQAQAVDADMEKWRYGEDALQADFEQLNHEDQQ